MVYRIKHDKHSKFWGVWFGDTLVEIFRAKSRSKVEMQKLLDHMNQQLKLEDK